MGYSTLTTLGKGIYIERKYVIDKMKKDYTEKNGELNEDEYGECELDDLYYFYEKKYSTDTVKVKVSVFTEDEPSKVFGVVFYLARTISEDWSSVPIGSTVLTCEDTEITEEEKSVLTSIAQDFNATDIKIQTVAYVHSF